MKRKARNSGWDITLLEWFAWTVLAAFIVLILYASLAVWQGIM